MADRKITELLEAGTLTGAELIALVQSGVTRQTTINALKELVLAVAPQGFEIGDWYVTRGNALAVVTISALPGDGGAQITDVAYRVDGGSWISSGGTGSFNITGLTNGVECSIQLRAINVAGAGDASDTKAVTPATVPDAFASGDWSIAPGDAAANVTLIVLPADGGASITDIEYRLDGGSWSSSGGAISFTISGLTNGQPYDVELRAVNSVSAGGASDTKQVEPEAASDTTAPILSSAAATEDGHDAADLSVSTDEGNGTLYWVITTSATTPSASQVRAGQDHTGASAADSGSDAVAATGPQSSSASGLVAETTYYAHFMHEDAASNQSSVATSAAFTTEAEDDDEWSPLDLGAKLLAWWDYADTANLWQDTSATTAVTSDTDPIGRVSDKSGNGKHLLQATSGSQPAYRTGPARAVFDGGSDYLSVASPAFPISEMELFQVFEQHAANTAWPGVYVFAPSSGTDWQKADALVVELSNNASLLAVGANNSSLGLAWSGSGNTPLALTRIRLSGGSALLAVNGSTVSTDASYTLDSAHSGALIDGARVTSGNVSGSYGPISRRETVLTTPLTSEEAAALTNYMMTRHGL